MRGSIKKTPTSTKKVVGAGGGGSGGVDGGSVKVTSGEKKSGRKLVQARLPFKIIAPATDEGVVADDGASVVEIIPNPRKRKLYETESKQGKEGEAVSATECSKENLSAATPTKKSKTIDNDDVEKDDDNDVVILLEDSDNISCDDTEDHDLGRVKNKKNKQTPKSKKNNKKKAMSHKSDTPKSDKAKPRRKSSVSTKCSGETPKRSTTKSLKISESLKATPKTRQETRQADPDLAKDNEEKDLMVSGGVQNKRRKSLRNVEKTIILAAKQQEGARADVSSDDADDAIAIEQNPQKRLKVTSKSDEIVVVNKNEEEKKESTPSKTIAVVVLDDENDSPSKTSINDDVDLEVNTIITEEDITVKEKDNILGTPSALNKSSSEKILTPKQKKLHDQRRKAREEKELILQKEKEQKQLEKEQREQEKKREREQRDEQRRKEREEKEEQRRKEREEKDQQKRKEREEKDEQRRLEREEKERKRNAELESKNEEKRKKEQEKEEAELKKKRAAAAFTKFFVQKPASRVSIGSGEQEPQQEDNSALGKQLAFQPFQIKGDMKLAPLKRNTISLEARGKLDGIVHYDGDDESDNEEIVRSKPLQKSQLYVSELRSGKITPSKWIKPALEMSQDVIVVDDELERIGQAIDVEHKLPVEHLRAKFFKFHENRRPPYYGTWRKKTSIIRPRRPFAQDMKFLDYEVDSDLEWEEEEPGESLDGSDDEKEKESEDEEDYEVDNEWFVPHGHLSDEELQNDDEFDDGNTREAQKAKLQILQQEFAQEMRKQTKKIKPRLIGCIWTDINGNKPEECPNIIWESLNKRAMLCMGPPIILEDLKPNIDEEESNCSPAEKRKPIVLSSDLQKDLVRLVHGNKHSKNFIINEYLAYLNTHVEAIRNGEALLPSKAMVREKIDEFAEWQVIEETSEHQPQQSNNNTSATAITTKKQKKPKKRLCWIVAHDVLLRFELTELTFANNWNYISTPKFMTNSIASDSKETLKINNDEANESPDEEDQQTNGETATTATTSSTKSSVKNNNVLSITKFTKVLTAEELRKAAMVGSPTMSIKNNEVSTSNNNTNTTTTSSNKNDSIASTSSSNAQQKKKRVALLMSVPRGEQIPIAAKNVLISKFLKKGDPTTTSTPPTTTTTTIKSTNNNNSILTGITTKRKTTVIDDNAVADDDDDIIMLD